MKVSDYIVNFFADRGVTDAFGVPGGVVLELIYAFDRGGRITPHLMYHEQGAAFAASGYAQTNGRLGLAYATKGPGITNMITGIADAYFDSTPVILITAHGNEEREGHRIRTTFDQELNPEDCYRNITKAIFRINMLEDVNKSLHDAYSIAMTGRKGPVLLDFDGKLLSSEYYVELQDAETSENVTKKQLNYERAISELEHTLSEAKRPVLLIGDGISQSGLREQMKMITGVFQIPILSSMSGQDLIPNDDLYFGYIGSHGLRYSNFILSKADCIVSIGNRLAFPVESKTFSKITRQATIVRFDIDDSEFERKIPNSNPHQAELNELLYAVSDRHYEASREWIACCRKLKADLGEQDRIQPVQILQAILSQIEDPDTVVVSDIGENEIWLAQSYALANIDSRKLHSKSFKVVGNALPKAIGAYYSARHPVVCVCGDQGFQMNIQELEYVGAHNIPVKIVLVNNQESGAIRVLQERAGRSPLLSTLESGYGIPDVETLAKAYGIPYFRYADQEEYDLSSNEPCLIEILMHEKMDMIPYIPKGEPCQNMFPVLEPNQYAVLDRL